MRVPGLYLLGQGMNVAKAALKGAASKNRIDLACFVDPVGDFDRAVYGVRCGEPNTRAVRDVDGTLRTGAIVYLGKCFERIGPCRTELHFGTGDPDWIVPLSARLL